MWGLLTVSYHSARFGGHRGCGNSDIIFFSFFTWPHNQKVTQSWSCSPSITSYHPFKFGGHRYCRSADIRSYICHETTWSKGNVTWCVGYCDHKLPLCHLVTTKLPLSFFHLSCGHVIESLCDFEDWVPPSQVTTLWSWVAIDIAEV